MTLMEEEVLFLQMGYFHLLQLLRKEVMAKKCEIPGGNQRLFGNFLEDDTATSAFQLKS